MHDADGVRRVHRVGDLLDDRADFVEREAGPVASRTSRGSRRWPTRSRGSACPGRLRRSRSCGRRSDVARARRSALREESARPRCGPGAVFRAALSRQRCRDRRAARGRRRMFRLHRLRFAASIRRWFVRRGFRVARGEPNPARRGRQANSPRRPVCIVPTNRDRLSMAPHLLSAVSPSRRHRGTNFYRAKPDTNATCRLIPAAAIRTLFGRLDCSCSQAPSE